MTPLFSHSIPGPVEHGVILPRLQPSRETSP
jgi:hypothetical protein